jgi:hypothetical protein
MPVGFRPAAKGPGSAADSADLLIRDPLIR